MTTNRGDAKPEPLFSYLREQLERDLTEYLRNIKPQLSLFENYLLRSEPFGQVYRPKKIPDPSPVKRIPEPAWYVQLPEEQKQLLGMILEKIRQYEPSYTISTKEVFDLKVLKGIAHRMSDRDDVDTLSIWLECDRDYVKRLKTEMNSVAGVALEILEYSNRRDDKSEADKRRMIINALEELKKCCVISDLKLEEIQKNATSTNTAGAKDPGFMATVSGNTTGEEPLTSAEDSDQFSLGNSDHFSSETQLKSSLETHPDSSIGIQSNSALGTQSNSPFGTQTNPPMGTQTNSPMRVQTNSPMGGQTNSALGTQNNSAMGTQTNSPIVTQNNSPLGILRQSLMEAQSNSSIGAQINSPMGGQTNSPLGTQTNSPMGGQTNSPMGGQTNSPMGGQTNSPVGGQTNSPMGGQTNSPMGGQTNYPYGAQTLGTQLKYPQVNFHPENQSSTATVNIFGIVPGQTFHFVPTIVGYTGHFYMIPGPIGYSVRGFIASTISSDNAAAGGKAVVQSQMVLQSPGNNNGELNLEELHREIEMLKKWVSCLAPTPATMQPPQEEGTLGASASATASRASGAEVTGSA